MVTHRTYPFVSDEYNEEEGITEKSNVIICDYVGTINGKVIYGNSYRFFSKKYIEPKKKELLNDLIIRFAKTVILEIFKGIPCSKKQKRLFDLAREENENNLDNWIEWLKTRS
jgi:hypothetical protein